MEKDARETKARMDAENKQLKDKLDREAAELKKKLQVFALSNGGDEKGSRRQSAEF